LAAQVTNYQCPNCMGPLQFKAETGKLGCDFCDSTFTVAEVEALYAKKDAQAAQNMAQADAERETKSEQAAQYDGDWDAENMRSYLCPACGAELICDMTTAATSCPYCGNPTIVPGQFAGAQKPEYMIPFKLRKEEAISALKQHYEGKVLLPKAFKDENHLSELNGVYVPFWLYDYDADGSVSYDASKDRSYRSGDYEVTETKHYRIIREGGIAMEKIPVDASGKMSDAYMDSLEPYRYSDLTDFSNAYLSGYLADKYDVTAEMCEARADQRAEQTLVNSLRETVVGYDRVSQTGKQIRLHKNGVHYALFPVWLLYTKWNDKDFLFAMNGQTGKFVGDLPIDKKKRWLIFGGIWAAAAALMLLLVSLTGMFSDEPMLQMAAVTLLPLLISSVWVLILTSQMRSVFSASEASKYMTGELDLIVREDIYSHTTERRRKIETKK